MTSCQFHYQGCNEGELFVRELCEGDGGARVAFSERVKWFGGTGCRRNTNTPTLEGHCRQIVVVSQQKHRVCPSWSRLSSATCTVCISALVHTLRSSTMAAFPLILQQCKFDILKISLLTPVCFGARMRRGFLAIFNLVYFATLQCRNTFFTPHESCDHQPDVATGASHKENHRRIHCFFKNLKPILWSVVKFKIHVHLHLFICIFIYETFNGLIWHLRCPYCNYKNTKTADFQYPCKAVTSVCMSLCMTSTSC